MRTYYLNSALITILGLLTTSCNEDKKNLRIPPLETPERVDRKEATSGESGYLAKLQAELRSLTNPVERAIYSVRWGCERVNAFFDESTLQCRSSDPSESFYFESFYDGQLSPKLETPTLSGDTLDLGRNQLSLRWRTRTDEDRSGELLTTLFENQMPPMFPHYYSPQYFSASTIWTVGSGPLAVPSLVHPQSSIPISLRLSAVPYGRPFSNDSMDFGYLFYEPEVKNLFAAMTGQVTGASEEFFRIKDPQRVFGKFEGAAEKTTPKNFEKLFAWNIFYQENFENQKPPKAELFSGLREIKVAYDEFKERGYENNFHPDRVETTSILGCADNCILSMKFDLPVESKYVAEFNKRYLRGAQAFQYLQIRERSSRTIEAVVILNQAATASIILINRIVYDRASQKMASHHLGFDRDWSSLWPVSRSDVLVPKDYLAQLNALRSSSGLRADENRVLFCDDFQAMPPDHRLIVGPYAPSTPSGSGLMVNQYPTGSLDGWFENSEGSLSRFLSTQTEFYDESIPIDAPASHGNDVVGVYVRESSRNRYARMSVSSCLPHYDEWKEAVSSAGIRVVNHSAMRPMDETVCRENVGSAFSGEEKERFLWVVAAGNAGRAKPARYECPLNLPEQDRPNVITVAAMNDDFQLASYSNHGADWVDIAARGNQYSQNRNDEVQGTSFAAPVVAHVAARLSQMKNYRGENWSISVIRLALLLGSNLPKTYWGYSPLDVRSGGFVEEDYSIAVLEYLNTHFKSYSEKATPTDLERANYENLLQYIEAQTLPDVVAKDLLFHAFGCADRPSKDCEAKVDAKIQHLKKTKVIL